MSLSVLSDAEAESLHEKTLEVLEDVGFRLAHEEGLARVAKAGAHVDRASGTVRFPRALVAELLAQAPAVALQTGLNGRVLEAGGDNRYYLSLVTDPYIVEYPDTPRRPVLEDVRRHTVIGESLERVDILMRMEFPASDIPEPDSRLKTMEVFLLNHTKHTAVYPTSVENCQIWMDVLAVIAEAAGVDAAETPLGSVAMAVTSPLQVHGANIEIMKMAIERCYPIVPTVCPIAGFTSPYSLAGTALLANVEALLPVLIAQIYKPGQPVFYAVGPSSGDLKTGQDLYYRAEKMHFKLIGARMGKFYGLPIAGEAGGSLTHRADVQNGAESLAYLLAAVAGGQNIVGGLGSLHNANGMSAEQIVMQCGLADMAEYLARGVDLSEHKLALDSIRAAGPGGNYLSDALTVELLRCGEFFSSPDLDLSGGYQPERPGAYQMAHEKARQIVDSYRPTVPENVREAIKQFFGARYSTRAVAERD